MICSLTRFVTKKIYLRILNIWTIASGKDIGEKQQLRTKDLKETNTLTITKDILTYNLASEKLSADLTKDSKFYAITADNDIKLKINNKDIELKKGQVYLNKITKDFKGEPSPPK